MPRNEEAKEILGLNRITKKRIMELCKRDKLYQTPELNDVLYLHYQGFEFIECLEDYSELKCLWLECNAISEIKGLDKQTKLKCLFLNSNLIRKIENLECCKELDTINLAQNHIRKIENCGFEVLPTLNTLNLGSNYLKDCEGLKELENCKTLSVLDLSNNRIDDILVVKIFAKMPELKVLVLQGNPVVSKIPQYRKTLILECKQLTYLDSRPVFPKDRACAEAWKRGGYEEERKENERWNRKERKKMRDGVNATIKLRNRNRKPDGQMSLLPSSESENETSAQKKNLPIQTLSDVSTDCIWDEVTEDNKAARSLSSDIGTESLQSSKSGSNEEIFDSMAENEDNVERIKDKETPKEKTQNMPERELQQKESGETNDLTSLDKDIDFEKPNCDLVEKTAKSKNNLESSAQKIPLHIENDSSSNKHIVHTSVDSDTDSPENYKPIIEAINKISKSEEYSGSILNKNDEHLNNNDDNYEPLKELEETMSILLKPATDDQLSSQLVTKRVLKKPQHELEIQQERSKVNLQLKTDFEELSTNLNAFVKQLGKDEEERQEVMTAIFNKNISAQESSCESSESDEKVYLEEGKFERTIEQWDRDSRYKKDNKKYKDEELIRVKQTKDINEDFKDLALDNVATNDEQTKEPEQCEETWEITNKEKLQGTSSFESFNYTPMDISLLTQKSNEALLSLERESKELKKLLQQLENKNEELFKDINAELKCQGKKECQESELKECADVRKENVNEMSMEGDLLKPNAVKVEKDFNETDLEDQKQIVSILLEELLKSLQLKEKSYEFPDPIEYPEEYELTMNTSQPQNQLVSKTIPEFVESFKRFYENIETKSLSLEKPADDKALQKSLVLKELSKQTNLKQFNNDTPKSLNDQLEQIKSYQHKKVRRMVDRVYAQKDRYNDTLELVDGKLMVRTSDTNELQELPQPSLQQSSDSEADYDTAQSEEEERNESCTKLKKNLREAQKCSRSYKPLTRKSSEQLVIQALIANKTNGAADESEEESNEEFYSLETQDTTNLYNIDKEFFNKLTLDNLNLSQTDEHHIVQCARSYEELKHCLKLSKEERCLTEEENVVLEDMMERKCVQITDNSQNLLETAQNSKKLSIEEQLWPNKITLKSEEPKSLKTGKEDFKVIDLKSSEEAIQLFEYTNDTIEKNLKTTGHEELKQRTLETEDKLEKYCEELNQKILLNSLAEKNEKFQNENVNENYAESILNTERQSEEEKNEIENNIDFESAASHMKAKQEERNLITEPEQLTVAGDTLGGPLLDSTSKTINEFVSNDVMENRDSGDIEILECSLEILGCNDELVDTITVNAELHF